MVILSSLFSSYPSLLLHINLALSKVTDSTAIGDWSLVELAVEILSACLPTMTPFLHIRRHWSQLQSSFRYGKRAGRNSDMANDRSQPFKRPRISFKDSIQYRPDTILSPETSIKASAALPRSSRELDDVPLRTILVTQDLDWTEERTKPSVNIGSQVAGDMV